jgi:stage IV sporulation protein B
MKRFSKIAILLFLCIQLLSVTVFGRELTAVGQVVGLEVQDGTVTVAAFDTTLGVAAQNAGIEIGDRVVNIDGMDIGSAADIRKALTTSKGTVSVRVRRGDKEYTFQIEPAITADGPKLGLYLRQGVTGIGTVTWYDPQTGTFGTLGHGVSTPAGQLLSLVRGNAFTTSVVSVRKGQAGEPGQLMGSATDRTIIGTLTANTGRGVFGTTDRGWEGRVMQTATWDEIRPGPATILSTISGNEVREYSVEILKIYPKANQSGRNLMIRITDPALLEATGGIVQGMSGSPIIQDGKLVGAVTHVLVNDPTTGYGIFIENMLDAAA